MKGKGKIMKFFTNKEITKKIIIAILLVMTFNFIIPITSHADFGGALFKPISQLLCAVSDLVIKGLQKYFIGVDDIQWGGISEIESNSFFIRYSPGIIFSGKVAGLKVNFINAEKSDSETVNEYNYSWGDSIGEYSEDNLPGFSDPNFDKNEVYSYIKTTDNNWYELTQTKVHYILMWEYKGKKYTAVKTNPDFNGQEFYKNKNFWQTVVSTASGTTIPLIGFKLIDSMINDTGTNYNLYELNTSPTGDTVTKESSAFVLKDTVATWYKALRAIALVGLLSVLVYIGIRILISSTGQEKAKYKKMITDWVAAICILFVLQYIMLFITEITEKITDVLAVNIVGPNGEDILMSNLRNNIGDATDFSEIFPEMLMYMVLVIYTCIFTFQYLKRLLYMAFFTMIAPLIALTYPLDKIKDGQAQAFTMWVREYTFNALLQPMHLLLYYIFVSSAMSLVNKNPLYAIVAIGFLTPAEKFFRKMFGFEKATSAGQMGAAAGGALIMNAINKMGHRSGKQAAGKSGGDSGSSGGASGSTPRYASTPDKGMGGGKPKNPPKDKDGNPIGTAGHEFGQDVVAAPKSGKANLWNGAKTLAGHYNQFNKPNATRNAKALGRGARKLGVGALGAATLGTVGLAAGIATGDLGNAFKYGAAGVGAGYMGANNLGDKATELEKKNREMFKEGTFGTDEYNRRNSIKELTNDHDFNNLCKAMGVTNQKGREVLIRQFHENGITKSEDIKKAMNAGANTDATREQVIAAAKIRKEAERYGYKKKDVAAMVGNNQKALDLIDLMW